MVTVDDERVGVLLRSAVVDLAPGEYVSELKESYFRGKFQQVLMEKGLGGHGYKPYSLRRGGATEDFRRHGQMDRCMVRGRWKHQRSARVYILEGLEMYAQLQLTQQHRAALGSTGRVLRKLLR